MKFRLFLSLVVVVTCCSCSIFSREPYQVKSIYELTSPNIINVGETTRNVEVKTFDNLTVVNRQMLFLDSDRKLEALPYNEWAQSPEYLLQRLLISRLVGVSAVHNMEINGEIWNFSLDIDKKVAHLGVNYQILCYVNKREEKVFRGTIQTQAALNEKSGEAAARAMSQCANELADKLIDLIKNIEKEKE